MTAHELARKLLEMPDVMVTVSSYEGNVDEVDIVCEPAAINLNVNTKWYYGKHSYWREYSSKGPKPETLAIHIG